MKPTRNPMCFTKCFAQMLTAHGVYRLSHGARAKCWVQRAPDKRLDNNFSILCKHFEGPRTTTYVCENHGHSQMSCFVGKDDGNIPRPLPLRCPSHCIAALIKALTALAGPFCLMACDAFDLMQSADTVLLLCSKNS